jgi:hypothetical protein
MAFVLTTKCFLILVYVFSRVAEIRNENNGGLFTKTFFFINYKWTKYTRVFIPGRPFQPCAMFLGQARSLP